jgi:hypothetical protein
MSTFLFEIKAKGKRIRVPATSIDGKIVISTGKWIKKANYHDEDWIESNWPASIDSLILRLKEQGLKADLFTFAQRIPDTKPHYAYHVAWDNIAAIPIVRYEDWWKAISTDMRKDVKRASIREVITRVVNLDDDLIRGIMEIHNEAPTRKGRPYIHYGKDFETVKSEYSSYLDQSEFIAAFYKSELIGLIKIVYVGNLACMMQILSKSKHFDKRPTNALIAKAVEVCVESKKAYLTYGRYFYGNKVKSSLVDFKHRNGFLRIIYPRYFIPMTLKGWLAINLGLHKELLEILPSGVISFFVNIRSFLNKKIRYLSIHKRIVESSDESIDIK